MNQSIQRMQERLKTALVDDIVERRAKEDFIFTLKQIGLTHERAIECADLIVHQVLSTDNIITAESILRTMLKHETVAGSGNSVLWVLDGKLSGRADLIFDQLSWYLAGLKGRGLDFGCGDAKVTMRLIERQGHNMTGCDVRKYVDASIVDRILYFPVAENSIVALPAGHFDFGIITNVLHHEQENEYILRELARLIKSGGRLMVIETVPLHDDPVEFEVTFLNDWLYNRVFHDADIPVPGTYETFEGWVSRFEAAGFRLVDGVPNKTDLGFDQPTIRDRHVRYALERI